MTKITSKKYKAALGFTLDTIFKDIKDHPSVAREELLRHAFNEWFNVGTENEDTIGKDLGLPTSTNRFQAYGNITNYFDYLDSVKVVKNSNNHFAEFFTMLHICHSIAKEDLVTEKASINQTADLTTAKNIAIFNDVIKNITGICKPQFNQKTKAFSLGWIKQ